MEQTPTTRRSFFGVAGGAALLCTIGGKEVDVSTPGGLRKADAAAARVRRPRAAAAQAVPQIQPAPGGTPARVLGPGRDRALGDHADAPRRLAQPQPLRQERLHGVRLPPDDARVRRLCGGASDDPRPHADRRGRRRARRALPQRRPQAEPGGDDAPARRQVRPGVRRRLHGRVHARGRLHRAGRVVHLPVGVHARVGRRLAVPRPRAQPHAQHVPGPVRRDHRAPQGREAARPPLHAVRPPAAAAGHPPAGEPPLHQRARLCRQHADPDRARRRGRRDPRVRHGLQLPHVPHPRPPLERSGGDVHRQPGDGPERDASRPASSRTTQVAGSTTATSSRIRTRAWRAGTSSTLDTEERYAHPARRSGGGRTARARRRERPDVSEAAAAGPGPVQAQGPARDLHGLQEDPARPLRLPHDPEGRQQGPRRGHDPRAQRRLSRGREDQRQEEALPAADRQPRQPEEGPPPCAREHAERVPRERRQRGHRQRVHDARLQVQRVLLHEPQGLHDEPPDRAPDGRLRPVRVQHRRRPDPQLGGLLRQRRGVLHRPDPAAGEAGAHDRLQRLGLGQPAGLQRHQHALRDDHEEPLLQQRGGHRAERAGLGEVPAPRGQRDHRQRHLLEQLQLPPGQAAVRGPQGHAPRRSSRSAPASCCSAVAATGSRTTASTATSWPASRRSRASCWPRTPAPAASSATSCATTSSAWAAPTPTATT